MAAVVTAPARGGPEAPKARRGGRFYNIYNTYVYGDKGGAAAASPVAGLAGQAMLFVGASALVLLAGRTVHGTTVRRARWRDILRPRSVEQLQLNSCGR